MKNGYKVIWSAEAVRNIEDIIQYLQTNWTDKEIRKFFVKLDKRIALISSRPLIFPSTQTKAQAHRSVLSKQTTIYYKVLKDQILILALFDNRQDPDKLKT